MPAESDIHTVTKRVQEMIAGGTARGVHLRLRGYRYDDGWLYLVVEPTQPGERASQHARFMTEIERTLLKEGFDQVLLVPAVPEHAGLQDVPPPDA